MTSITSRLKRLFQAEAHAQIDRVEEPMNMLNQALREMAVKGNKLLAAKSHMESQVERLKEQLESLVEEIIRAENRAAIALENGDEEQSKAYLKQKLVSKKGKQELERQQEKLRGQLMQLSQRLQEHQLQFKSIKTERVSLMARYHCAKASRPVDLDEYQESCEELVERMRERVDLIEAHANATGFNQPTMVDNDTDFEVDVAFAALKKQQAEASHA